MGKYEQMLVVDVIVNHSDLLCTLQPPIFIPFILCSLLEDSGVLADGSCPSCEFWCGVWLWIKDQDVLIEGFDADIVHANLLTLILWADAHAHFEVAVLINVGLVDGGRGGG